MSITYFSAPLQAARQRPVNQMSPRGDYSLKGRLERRNSVIANSCCVKFWPNYAAFSSFYLEIWNLESFDLYAKILLVYAQGRLGIKDCLLISPLGGAKPVESGNSPKIPWARVKVLTLSAGPGSHRGQEFHMITDLRRGLLFRRWALGPTGRLRGKIWVVDIFALV